MADFSELKAAIRQDIKDNTGQEITGDLLQGDLLRMVDDINLAKADAAALAVLIVNLANKVDKVTGKGLSTNDYTDTDKAKLAGLPDAAQLLLDFAAKQNVITDLDTIRSGAAAGATALQKSDVFYDCVDHLDGNNEPVPGVVSKTFVELVTAAGGSFNTSSQYFEIGDVVDITKQEMDLYYARRFTNAYKLRDGVNYQYRTCLPFPGGQTQYFLQNSKVVYVPPILYGFGYDYCFDVRSIAERAYYLKRWMAEVNGNIAAINTCFQFCYELEFVNIKGLNYSFPLSQSPNFTAEGVAYLINNAGTNALTITLEATAYTRAMADASVTAALAAHTNVTLASA